MRSVAIESAYVRCALHSRCVLHKTLCDIVGRVNNSKEGMMVFQRYFAFALSAALSAGTAIAQEQAASRTAGAAAAPTPLYQSAFSDYKVFLEPQLMSWRAANDQVRDGGGMAGHDMSKMKSLNPGTAGEAVMPAHDMNSMKDPEKTGGHDMSEMAAMPVPAAGKTTAPKNAADQKKSMPHDMSKMNRSGGGAMDMPGHDMKSMGASKPSKKVAPATATAADAPRMRGSMPGHDMANMGKTMPAKPVAAGAKTVKKPAAEAPQQRMDHSKMNHKE